MKHRLAFGLKIKRWLLAGFLGLIIEMLGMLLVFNSLLDDSNLEWERKFYCQITYASTSLGIWGQWPQVLVFPLLGVGLVIFGFYRSSRSLLIFLAPNLRRKELVERAYQKKYLQKGPKITAIGGGTGLSTMLRGLKEYTENITAVVSVADDGGSSGKLRNELGMLPPGDIRNCLVALADQESLLDSLFQYRFSEQHLSGHCMGNLLLAALNDMSGDLEQAVHSLSQIFAIRGQVLPATLEPVSLGAEFMDGETALGQSVIPEQKK
ncbi:MAG: YvcK family protein, partial [Clostridia bacterium]|nr:YvcK family protein [Clostridia bacterium]